MAKLLSLASILVIALGFVVSATFAEDTGTIDNTGPGSTNTITFKSLEDCREKNDINIEVDNETDQESDSGDATNSGNTNGGGSTTGRSSNDNATTITVFVVNDAGDDCVAVEQEVEQPEEPEQPETPTPTDGDGGGGATLGDSDEVAFETLPATGVESPILVGLGALAIGSVVVAVLSRFGVARVRARILG